MFMLCIKLFMFMLELHLGIESFLIFNVTYTLCAKNASSSVVAQYRSILVRGLCFLQVVKRSNWVETADFRQLQTTKYVYLIIERICH